MSPVAAAIIRAHPEMAPEQVAAVVESVRSEIYWLMLERSMQWRESNDVGARWFEAEARSCASLVHSVRVTR